MQRERGKKAQETKKWIPMRKQQKQLRQAKKSQRKVGSREEDEGLSTQI